MVTDINGNFSFQRMRPGTYTLTEVQPTILVDGLTRAGIGLTSDGVAGTNVITGIVVSENQNGTTFRFAQVSLIPSLLSKRLLLTTATGSISAGTAGTGLTYVKPLGNADPSGYVYVDVNNIGVKNADDPGIPGVLMTLTGVTDSGVPVEESQFTNAEGFYRFDELQPGVYAVTESQPTGFNAGKETLGTLGGSVGNHQFTNIVLGPTDVGTGYNFGQLLASFSIRKPAIEGLPILAQAWNLETQSSLTPLTPPDDGLGSVAPVQPLVADGSSDKPSVAGGKLKSGPTNKKPEGGRLSILGSVWNWLGLGE